MGGNPIADYLWPESRTSLEMAVDKSGRGERTPNARSLIQVRDGPGKDSRCPSRSGQRRCGRPTRCCSAGAGLPRIASPRTGADSRRVSPAARVGSHPRLASGLTRGVADRGRENPCVGARCLAAAAGLERIVSAGRARHGMAGAAIHVPVRPKTPGSDQDRRQRCPPRTRPA